MRLVDGDLKTEMEKAMRDIQKINKELSDINKKKAAAGVGLKNPRPGTKQESSEHKFMVDDYENDDFIVDENSNEGEATLQILDQSPDDKYGIVQAVKD